MRSPKRKVLSMFTTLNEWERMSQQNKDAYLSGLKHPDWLPESELVKLAPTERDEYYKSVRDCELTQFLLYLGNQESTTKKGMEANIAAADLICDEVNKEIFPIPPRARGSQLSKLISLREDWIKLCECKKRVATELYYESQGSSLTPRQKKQVVAIANSATASAKSTEAAKKSQDKRLRPPRKNGRILTNTEIDRNKKLNELIAEIRRRAKSKYTLGRDGITNAYNDIEKESQQAGSKWQKVISIKPRKTIIDKALHNKRYVVKQNGKQRDNLSGE